MIAYDRRRGWRGPIANLNFKDNLIKNLDKKHKLEKSVGWKIAIVKKVDKFSANIQFEKNLKGVIKYKDISWTKEFDDLLKVGDVIYVKKLKIILQLMQLQKLMEYNSNGSIWGRVMALSGGFSLKIVNLIEHHKLETTWFSF